MDIRLSWPHLRFIGVLRANEGTIKLQILDHACSFCLGFFLKDADHIRLVLLNTLVAFVAFDL